MGPRNAYGKDSITWDAGNMASSKYQQELVCKIKKQKEKHLPDKYLLNQEGTLCAAQAEKQKKETYF